MLSSQIQENEKKDKFPARQRKITKFPWEERHNSQQIDQHALEESSNPAQEQQPESPLCPAFTGPTRQPHQHPHL